ncbi:MAG: TspO/MBR family protein [Thermoguttaceae bacterium]
MNGTRQAVGLVVFVAVCAGAAAAGGAATYPRIQGWYAALAKPSWTPPNWVFGPVWTVLYMAMAVAAWLVWRQKGLPDARGALILFALQLGLNVAWPWLFFGLRNPALGFLDILLLWMAIAATLVVFRRKSTAAGLLIAPYLAWVTFAAALNLSIWQRNSAANSLTGNESSRSSTFSPPGKSISPAEKSTSKNPLSKDDEFRKLVVGAWQDEYQGKRTLTLREDGTGTMVVELSGLTATLVAPRLTFNMAWSIANRRLKKRSLGGQPAAQVGLILKTMGDTVDEPILALTADRLLLLDQDGKTKYDWRRMR